MTLGMQKIPDTRDKNQYFDMGSPERYLKQYALALREALSSVQNLADAVSCLEFAARAEARIFVCGNGGSAAISDHLECDFSKGCHVPWQKSLLIKNLSSSPAVMTAIGNDIGFEEIFSRRLQYEDAHKNEVLILISSSGNSPNIIKALGFAKDRGMTSIGLSGFDGGTLKREANISLHVPFNNYGVIEDAHQAIMHVLAQVLYLKTKG
jgi:D-sedoheptulose 7-phosphate isomerase